MFAILLRTCYKGKNIRILLTYFTEDLSHETLQRMQKRKMFQTHGTQEMSKEYCPQCQGAGTLMGSGFVSQTCPVCNGDKYKLTPPKDQDEINYLLTKSNEHYQNAKANIKGLSDDITDDEAERLLDSALRGDNSTENNENPYIVSENRKVLIDQQTPKKRGRPRKNETCSV